MKGLKSILGSVFLVLFALWLSNTQSFILEYPSALCGVAAFVLFIHGMVRED